MQQSSFISSNSKYPMLDVFRKDIREKLFSRVENQKTVLKQAKFTQPNQFSSILRNSQSPKSPRTQQVTPQQSPQRIKQYSKHSPGGLSFKRSSVDSGQCNSSLMLPKKTLNEIVPIEKIQDLARALKGQSYGASDLYMQELRKLSLMILKE